MGASVLDMSMSLDGYVADADGWLGGPDGTRLHRWSLDADGDLRRPDGPAAELYDAIFDTGAVLVGRRLAEQVDHWGGDHHGRGVPIFVVSHRPPAPHVAGYPLVTYVPDGIERAMARARTAAGDRDVLVHGAVTATTALAAGVLDEIVVHQVPVLLGRGRRFLDELSSEVELEIVRVLDTPDATHLHYRVRR